MISRTDFLRACKRARRDQPEFAYGGMGLGIGLGLSHLQGRSGGVAPGPAFIRGWNPNYNAGTNPDYVVDNVSGVDSGSVGPFASANYAIGVAKAAGGQKWIAVRKRGGPYREMPDFAGWSGSSGAKNKFTGWGDEKPIFRGDDIVTGWTRCDATHAAILGDVLGVNGSPVFYRRTARASISSPSLVSMCVVENDEPVAIAQDYASQTNPHLTHDSTTMHTTTSFTLSGENVQTVTKSGVINNYTEAQLQNAFMAYHGGDNFVYFAPILSASGDTLTITPAHKPSPPNPSVLSFGLINALPALTAGRFGYVIVDANWVDVYLYPTNEANLASGIGIVSRKANMRVVGAEHLILEGFELRHMGGGDGATSTGVTLQIGENPTNTSGQDGIEVRHVKIAWNVAGSALFTYSKNLIFENCTIEDIYNRTAEELWMGISLRYIGTTRIGNQLRYLDMKRVEQSACQMYGQVNACFVYSKLTDCGQGGHANLFNSYFYGENVLFWGIETVDCKGYATWGSSRNVTIGMCLLSDNPLDDRNIWDQSAGLTYPPPDGMSTHFVINNTVREQIGIGTYAAKAMTIVARNNVSAGVLAAFANGQQPVDTVAAVLDSSYAALLGSTMNLGGVAAFDNQFAASDIFDGSSMDLKAGSPLIGLGGADVEWKLLEFEALYGINLHFDARGYAFPKLDFTGALAAARGADDTTAPTLSSPTAAAASSEAINIGVTTTEARGGVYYVVTTNGSTPSAAQIVAGKDASGSAAAKSDLLTNVSAGAKSATPSGLTPDTTYYVHWTHEDMHGNRSAVVSASAKTNTALTGIQMLAQNGISTTFNTTHTLTGIPAMLEGDLMLVVVTTANGILCSTNPIQTGWSQVGGSGWNGTDLPASRPGASGRSSIWAFSRIAGPGGVPSHSFVFNSQTATTVVMTYQHFRGDTPLSIPASGGAISTALPVVSLNNGDSAFTVFSSNTGNAAAPDLATSAAAFGVPASPAAPAGEGAWNWQFISGNHPKQLSLLKKIVSTGNYSPPASAPTNNFSAYTVGVRQ